MHREPESVRVPLPAGLREALRAHCAKTGEPEAHVIRTALAQFLDVEHHTLFQVSTAGALVEGVYSGCARAQDIASHGDTGLGTFEGLDGEGILADGVVYWAKADGTVMPAPPEALTPFWTACRFRADDSQEFSDVTSWADLCARLDGMRKSENLFTAFVISGLFDTVRWRVAKRSAANTDLADAVSTQALFDASGAKGQVVGFYVPAYAARINVPGYHLHFLSDDKASGGHVLDLSATALTVRVQHLADLHVALPQTKAFLEADLTRDPTERLHRAENDPAPSTQ